MADSPTPQPKTRQGPAAADPLAAERAVNPFTGRNRTKKHRAAILLAEDERSDEAIAADLDIARSTLSEWKHDPEFAAIVGDYQGRIIAASLRLPIARKSERIKQLNDLNQRHWRIIRDRAQRHAMDPDAPAEAATGMLVAQPKIAANGKTVVEWAFDKALDSSIRDTMKYAAQELGQLEETINVNHAGSIYRDDRYERASVETLEQIDRLLAGDA